MSTVPLIDQTLSNLCVDGCEVFDIEQRQDRPQQTSETSREEGSRAALSRIVQFVAHDFRHHLSAVYSNAEFLCTTNYTQYECEEILDEIRTAILCMSETLDSVLLYSKTGNMFHLRLESLKLVVERAVLMVRSHPDADQVNFIDETMSSFEVRADSRWLCSAIFNMLLNACQADQLSSELKEVRICCQQDGHYIYVRITDNGSGIPPALQKRIFQPFVSLQRRKGTGLGLTIAKSVAQGHGGEVYLEGSTPGSTSLILRLPKPDTAIQSF